MVNGFFLGGAAEGMMGAQKQALAERTQDQDVGLRTRALELQENQFANTVSQQATAAIDKQIADTLGIIGETVKSATEVGRPPDQILKTIAPLMQSAQALAAKGGRDPNAIAARVQALVANPGLVETAGAKGRAAATQAIEQERTIQNQPPGTAVEISPWKTPKERIEVEDKLRDDYLKQSKDFVVQRDFMDRIQSAPTTGAGDLALVFSYMKVLDPGSTVREGEFANAQNAAGVPDAVRGMWNQLVGGGKLATGARNDIKQSADTIWSQALNRHSSLTTQFSNIAKRNKLNPQNVIVDLTAGSERPSGVTSFGTRWNLRGQ